jgi:hypothetical protein
MLEKDPERASILYATEEVRSLDGTDIRTPTPESIDAKRMDCCICSISATVQLKKMNLI